MLFILILIIIIGIILAVSSLVESRQKKIYERAAMDFTAEHNTNKLYEEVVELKEVLQIKKTEYKKIINKGYGAKEKSKINIHTEIPCSRCLEGMMVKRTGKYGAFFGCDRYPTCKNTMKITNIKNAGKEVLIKELNQSYDY